MIHIGRNSKKYQKSLREQAHDRLVSMQAFGESKSEARDNASDRDKIFSFDTYKAYWKHVKYFVGWMKQEHPDITTLKSAKRYVGEWLKTRIDQVDEKGQKLSAWTIHLEAAALYKLFQIEKGDLERIALPKRERRNIKRSRVEVDRDKHFSKTNNDQLIRFCRGTGCRKNVLVRLEGRDLWTRSQMEAEVKKLENMPSINNKETKHLRTLKDALVAFPDQDAFVHHRKDKNGLYRYAPIIGPDKDAIIERFKETAPTQKVWLHVPAHADIHGYRAAYALRVYKLHARDIKTIPYDKVNRGTGCRYQGDVYFCRREEKGLALDRRSLRITSKALGHSRECVVAENYIRGL